MAREAIQGGGYQDHLNAHSRSFWSLYQLHHPTYHYQEQVVVECEQLLDLQRGAY